MREFSNERMYQVVSEQLDKFGVSRRSMGFDCARTAAMMLIEDCAREELPFCEICKMISEDYAEDYRQISNLIRGAIRYAWKHKNYDVWREHFAKYMDTPPVNVFLIYVAHLCYDILDEERKKKDGAARAVPV